MPLIERAQSVGLRVFGALPPFLKRVLVRAGTTTYTVGCVAVVRRGDEVLLLEQPHHTSLSLPGGFLERDETPAECLVREMREELGVEVPVRGEPQAVLVDTRARRVDLIFVVDGEGLEMRSTSAEVHALLWVAPSSLPVDTGTARAVEAALRATARVGTTPEGAAQAAATQVDAAHGGAQGEAHG